MSYGLNPVRAGEKFHFFYRILEAMNTKLLNSLQYNFLAKEAAEKCASVSYPLDQGDFDDTIHSYFFGEPLFFYPPL